MNTQIEARITGYLSAGGLFNPELMEHEKVRNLLIDCREQIAHAEKLAEALRLFLNKIDNITSDQFALGAERIEREAARNVLAAWEAGQ